jgi:protein involved in polysaccharide export with SLBB domain
VREWKSSSRGPGEERRSLRLFFQVVFLSIISPGLNAQQIGSPPEAATLQARNDSGAFSVSAPAELAGWQKRFTLGAGDVVNISLYEQPESERKGLIIGPDGRLNYLQARDIVAAGLTVDELRDKLDNVLLKFYRPPLRTIVVPQAYHSKKYFLLGNVAQKGVFPLDRPTTIVEAIAKAQGFITTVERRNTLMLADLPRAFLVRTGEGEGAKRVNVDFEALFLRGDLNQNIALAPDDYLYFPPLDLQEIYVLGEVPRPGVASYTPEMTALRAIASRGGFTERAYRTRILIVRGSLSHPQTRILNVSDVLKAQSLDVKLEARDIVYVSRKPWYKAEELLQAAITDFMRAAVVTWTGQNVGPFIKEPLF